MLRALEAGRHVITANKQLVAQHGDELFAAARANGVQLRFEAAVAGVVPVIRVIQESLAATRIEKVLGIVNGTTNFILTEMAATGASYDDALARAQELGYAEADPTEDVGGADAAAKMAILARLAFDTPVGLDDVTYEGITEIQPDDIAYAKELGLSLKLLGVAERRGDGISVRVFPCFLQRRPPAGPGRGRLQRGHGRGAGDHRDHDVGPGRRRAADRDRGARRPGLDPLRRGAGATSRAARLEVITRRQLVVLPPPRGRRPARGAGADRRRPRPQRDLGAERRPARPRRRRPPGDGPPRGARARLLRGARRDRRRSTSCAPRRARSG